MMYEMIDGKLFKTDEHGIMHEVVDTDYQASPVHVYLGVKYLLWLEKGRRFFYDTKRARDLVEKQSRGELKRFRLPPKLKMPGEQE